MTPQQIVQLRALAAILPADIDFTDGFHAALTSVLDVLDGTGTIEDIRGHVAEFLDDRDEEQTQFTAALSGQRPQTSNRTRTLQPKKTPQEAWGKMPKSRPMTAEQVAKHIGINRQSVLNMANRGTLPDNIIKHKSGNTVLFERLE